jgi:error-prone DNA polymerase
MVCAWTDSVTYAELQCVTNFSFLRGGSHGEELVMQAKAYGLAALAVTDHNTLAGVVRAHGPAKEMGLKFIVGVKLNIKGPSSTLRAPSLISPRETSEGTILLPSRSDGRRWRETPDEGSFNLLAYPTNRSAYGRLCRLLSMGQRRAEKGQCILTLEDVITFQDGMLFVLPDDSADNLALLRRQLKAPLWLALSHHHDGKDRERLASLAELAHKTKTSLIASNNILYHHPSRRPLQDILTCIREKTTLQEAGFLLEVNAERHIKTPDEMARLFRDYPQALSNTLDITDQCTFSLDELKYEYPDEPIPKGETPQSHLAKLAWAGAKERYGEKLPAQIRRNIEKELVLIEKLNYAPYFLTVHDIVNFARTREKPILCQGRGSAANSTVCYCIGITAVDPNQIDLLFERFISEERREPPDIDVDFEHERREEVIQYIYERYGRERAGLAATVITYRGRSAMREVGKVMGLSEDVTGALAGSVWGMMPEEMQEKRLREIGLDPDDPLLSRVLELTHEIAGFPRHLSQHVGGFILTRERLDETVPIGNAAMENRTVIEWDKDDIDTLAMLKVDVLALGMLTCIRKSFELLERWYGLHYVLATVPREDPKVYDMLCRADSVGVFQVESRAQMNMLPRLRPRCFYDLVIEVAIVRPGPIQGDMVHPYLRRRNGREPELYPAPNPAFGPPDELKQVLGRTKGVPLFQEQAMKLAMVAAEFTPGELNELRKAMATFRRRGTIGRLEQKMVNRMVERGYEPEFALRCFNQIKGFGEYGFPESHAASFAHLVYVSSWLKCHYPDVFCAALLNSQPMGFYAPAQIVRDAREHGVDVLAPDASYSGWDSDLEGQRKVRLGLREVDGLREEDATLIPLPRGVWGRKDYFMNLPPTALEKLAAADCFRSLGLDRRAALWEVKALTKSKPLPLFAHAAEHDHGTEQSVSLPEMPLAEHVVNDYQTIKLSLKAHPMQLLRGLCDAERVTDNTALAKLTNGRRVNVAGVVLVRQRPGSAKGVVFLTLEDEFGVCNVVVWPQVLEDYRAVVMGARLMLIKGRIQTSEGIIHIVADRIEDKTFWLTSLTEDSLTFRGSLARADEVKKPGPDPAQYQQSSTRHPRNIRVIPKSRDFH